MAHQNRLAEASSPYLLQHANNPVDWYEWGNEALQKAKNENKPIIVSIGYAACHWCHVMEHESFMDMDVAQTMNENFVCIKIDREERPDIDQIYMNAAQLINGQGGWPLNAFALPDGKPFYAGTYFPKKHWKNVLQQIAIFYHKSYDRILEQSESLTEGVNQWDTQFIDGGASKTKFQKSDYIATFNKYKQIMDHENGGFGGAPKFPLPVGIDFLLQYHHYTKNKEALSAVKKTLDGMMNGGIYDHLGGGFARYTVDGHWKIPHFEKMLYDNAQLIGLYARAFKTIKNLAYEQTAKQTISFLERELQHPDGGFYASINADSEGEEGKYYIWTYKELQSVFNADELALIKDYYHITQEGNWENGQNILFTSNAKREALEGHGQATSSKESMLQQCNEKLFGEREKRIRPTTDDKLLTAWNALTASALIDAYIVFQEKRYLGMALKTLLLLSKKATLQNHRLMRNMKEGKNRIAGFLDDYAFYCQACLKAYQVTFDVYWLNEARHKAKTTLEIFADNTQAMLFLSPEDNINELFSRGKEISDNVIPSSNSVMAEVFFQLGRIYNHQPWVDKSYMMLSMVLNKTVDGGPYYGRWAQLLGNIVHTPVETVVTGSNRANTARHLLQHEIPNALVLGGQDASIPALQNKINSQKQEIFICHDKTCELPVKKVDEAIQQITALTFTD